MYIACRSPVWVMWVGNVLLKSVYLRSFLAVWNFATSKNTVKNEATVDALWCVYAYRLHFGCCVLLTTTFSVMVCYIHIGVRLLRCSFYSVLGNAKASDSGTSDRYGLSRFFIICAIREPIVPSEIS